MPEKDPAAALADRADELAPAPDAKPPAPTGSGATEVTLSGSRLRGILLISTALVSGAGLTVEILKSIYRWKGRSGVVPLLSLSYEQNVPTFHTAVLLLLASAMSAILAARARRDSQPKARRDALPWWGLSVGFFYIAVDEVLSFHESWGAPFKLRGALHFGWVIPAAGIVLAIGALYARFLVRLPRRSRNRLLLAGAIYVFGAVVMELPLGYWTEKEGTKNLEYALIDWVEETMEMGGLVLFSLAAFDMLSSAGVVLRFRPRDTPAPDDHSA